MSERIECIRKLEGQSIKYCFDFNELIGSGSFGRVYRAWNEREPGESFAIKEVNIPTNGPNSMRIKEICEQEIDELESIKENNSPHIVKLNECVRIKNTIFLVMEYCEGGDLKHFLHEKNDLSTDEVIFLFNQILEGFKILRKHNRVHRDIKPENILVHHGVLKISDFQFTKDSVDAHTLGIGTLGYMAPEMIDSTGIDQKKVDIFSLGVLLYWMVFRKTPWEYNIKKEKNKITMHTVLTEMTKQLKVTPPAPYFPPDLYIDEGLKKLIVHMLSFEPENRIDWEELFTHKRLKQTNFKPRFGFRNPPTSSKMETPFKKNMIVTERYEPLPELSMEETIKFQNPFENQGQDKRKIFEKTLSILEGQSHIYFFLYNVLLKIKRWKKELNFQRDVYYQLIYYLSRLVYIYSYSLEQVFEHNKNSFRLENWEIFIEQKAPNNSAFNLDYTKSQYKIDCIKNKKNHENIISKIKDDRSIDAMSILDECDNINEISPLMLLNFMNCLKITLKTSKTLLNNIKNSKAINIENLDIVIFIEDLFLLATLKTSFNSFSAEGFNLNSFYERRMYTTISTMIDRVEGYFKDLNDFLNA